MSAAMLDMLKLPSDIILLDMLNGISVMIGLVSGGYCSGPRGPFIGRGCSMPGMIPGWGGMKPMGPGGKNSGDWPANLPP